MTALLTVKSGSITEAAGADALSVNVLPLLFGSEYVKLAGLVNVVPD